MILWLASYPRSGNTLLRLIFKQAFGRDTVSAHDDDAADIGADPAVAATVGHRSLDEPWPAARARLAGDAALHLVKTHDPPPDGGRAVYVVRDGRAATASFHHYLHDYPGHAAATAADVVLGLTPFGSWGEHLDRWDPLARPDTLLLRYEDLIADPGPQIDRLAAFAGLSPVADWHNDFDRLHAMAPRFFRAGPANDPAAALSPGDAELFWAEHGDWMARLGYATGPRPTPRAAAAPWPTAAARSSPCGPGPFRPSASWPTTARRSRCSRPTPTAGSWRTAPSGPSRCRPPRPPSTASRPTGPTSAASCGRPGATPCWAAIASPSSTA